METERYERGFLELQIKKKDEQINVLSKTATLIIKICGYIYCIFSSRTQEVPDRHSIPQISVVVGEGFGKYSTQ